MLEGESLDVGEAVALGAGPVEVVVLQRGPIGQELGVALAIFQGRLAQLADSPASSASWTSGSARKACALSRKLR